MPGRNLITAVPDGVNCAVPSIAPFKQKAAAASQNVTSPVATGDPFDTAAVKVTTVPAVTEFDDSVSVVLVRFAAWSMGAPRSQHTARIAATHTHRQK